MAKRSREARLVVRRGHKPDSEVPLEGQQLRIGSRSDCEVVVGGAHVSDLHGTLKLVRGQWILSNTSPHGIYVNQNPIGDRELQNGDLIQIGSDNLLEFVARTEGRRKSEAVSSPIVQLLRLDKPGVVVAGVAYLLLLVAGAIYLTRLDSTPSSLRLGRAQADAVLEATRAFLESPEKLSNGRPPPPVAATDPASNYYALVRLATSGEHVDERKRIVDDLMQASERHLTQAWHMESQRRWADAAGQYSSILELFPNREVPVTKLALQRRRITRRAAEAGE